MKKSGGYDRRDFLKLSSVALGGIILTGCGSGNNSGTDSSRLPNGYRYHMIKNIGDQIYLQGETFEIKEFLGSAHISTNGIITFDAEDKNQRRGIFQLGVDFSNDLPTINWERSAVLTGERLIDDRVVGTLGNYDVDESGNIAAIIDTDSKESSNAHYGPGIYHNQGQSSFKPVLIAGKEFSNGEKKCSGIFYSVCIKNNNIIAALNHLPSKDFVSSHQNSLLHIPDGILSQSSILVSEGDYLAGTNYKISSFGLFDHNDSGDLCATVYATAPTLGYTRSGTSDELHSGFNITTHIDSPSDHFMATASPSAGIDSQITTGEAGYAPRIGANGESYVNIVNDGQVSLTKDGQTILSVGDTSSIGEILHIGTGSVGADGTYYYTIRTTSADSALFAYNGVDHIKLLSSGNILSEGGEPIAIIQFGLTRRHVNSDNQLVFCCTFTDGSTALVVGIPN